jgi:hypothetical protein
MTNRFPVLQTTADWRPVNTIWSCTPTPKMLETNMPTSHIRLENHFIASAISNIWIFFVAAKGNAHDLISVDWFDVAPSHLALRVSLRALHIRLRRLEMCRANFVGANRREFPNFSIEAYKAILFKPR